MVNCSEKVYLKIINFNDNMFTYSTCFSLTRVFKPQLWHVKQNHKNSSILGKTLRGNNIFMDIQWIMKRNKEPLNLGWELRNLIGCKRCDYSHVACGRISTMLRNLWKTQCFTPLHILMLLTKSHWSWLDLKTLTNVTFNNFARYIYGRSRNFYSTQMY